MEAIPGAFLKNRTCASVLQEVQVHFFDVTKLSKNLPENLTFLWHLL